MNHELYSESAGLSTIGESLLKDVERWRKLFDQTGEGIVVLDQSGRVIEANQRFASMLGYSMDEVSGLHVWEWDARCTREQLHEKLARLDNHGYLFETQHRRRNGTVMDVEVNCNCADLADRKIFICVCRDITERKREEAVLREIKEQHSQLYAVITDAVFVHEIVDDREPGQFIDVNDAACQLLGYTREEMFRLKVTDIDAPESQVDSRAIIEKLKTGSTVLFEQIHVHKNGVRIPVEIHARAFFYRNRPAVISIIRDLTGRRLAENALRDSEVKLRELTKYLPETIFEMDLDGRLTFVNDAAFLLFGGTQEDFERGVYIYDFLDPADLPRARQNIKQILNGDEVGKDEYRLSRMDGSRFSAMVRSSPVFRDGQPVGLRGFVIDLTERERLEDERVKAAKLESIGLLAGGIAHDFNNILTLILGNMSLARMYFTSDADKAGRLLAASEKACFRAKELTQQLLTFSKGGEPVRKIFNISRLIMSVTDFALQGTNVIVHYSIPGELWHVDGDEGQITQVIQNLVINAQQAMPHGGRIDVEAGNVEIGPEDGLLEEINKYVAVSIRDQGIGIPDVYLSKIFDPYFTTKPMGSGLGLAACYSIIKRHNGRISVESTPGKGSTFRVLLPAADESEKEIEVTPESGELLDGKILLMDDEAGVRDVSEEMLRCLGFSVESVSDGASAVTAYRQRWKTPEAFDIVILDLTVTGGMGGRETLERLLEINPEVIAIVASGYSNDPVISYPEKFGFSGVLQKPFSFEELQKELQKVLLIKSGVSG